MMDEDHIPDDELDEDEAQYLRDQEERRRKSKARTGFIEALKLPDHDDGYTI